MVKNIAVPLDKSFHNSLNANYKKEQVGINKEKELISLLRAKTPRRCCIRLVKLKKDSETIAIDSKQRHIKVNKRIDGDNSVSSIIKQYLAN